MKHPVSIFPDGFRLDGRTALITGSARGLGWEIARALAQAGARAILHGRSAERLAPRVAELKAAGVEVVATPSEMGQRMSSVLGG